MAALVSFDSERSRPGRLMSEASPQVGKVLLVAPRMEPRGTSEYTVNLARRFAAEGVEVAVACAPGPMLGALQGEEVAVHTFVHLESPLLRRGEKRRLRDLAAGFAPALIHGQSPRVAGALKLLARRGGAPLALTVHWAPRRPAKLRKLAARLAGVIATSQSVREALVNDCGVPRDRIKVIHNGIDVERLAERDVPPVFRSRTPVVGSVGPIEKERGHELFVRAVALLAARGTKAQFVVAGEGRGVRSLRRLAHTLGLERCLTLATDFAAYEEILGALDIVVQSSQVDVSGFSMLEAMGRGRTVVAFNTGTACEIIEDQRTGLLVAKGDEEALADAIQRLIDDTDLARQMGENARRSVAEKFDVRAVARETLAYYARLIGE